MGGRGAPAAAVVPAKSQSKKGRFRGQRGEQIAFVIVLAAALGLGIAFYALDDVQWRIGGDRNAGGGACGFFGLAGFATACDAVGSRPLVLHASHAPSLGFKMLVPLTMGCFVPSHVALAHAH